MGICKVNNLTIGEGKPKVCVPLFMTNKKDIESQIDILLTLPFDIVEVRIDFFELNNKEVLKELLGMIKKNIQKPILITLRTKDEGGEADVSSENYLQLLEELCEGQFCDLIDIELSQGLKTVCSLIESAHAHKIKTVLSEHNFKETPDKSTMIESLEKMEILGGDILKVAYMPLSPKDVLEVLEVSFEMSPRLNSPIVVISMGEHGKISRITGELIGSALTFASATQTSAPGQLSAKDMDILLKSIHVEDETYGA